MVELNNKTSISVVPNWMFITKIASNKNTEPNKVYKKNWYPAFIFLEREPQIPTIKNIGIKIDSKAI